MCSRDAYRVGSCDGPRQLYDFELLVGCRRLSKRVQHLPGGHDSEQCGRRLPCAIQGNLGVHCNRLLTLRVWVVSHLDCRCAGGPCPISIFVDFIHPERSPSFLQTVRPPVVPAQNRTIAESAPGGFIISPPLSATQPQSLPFNFSLSPTNVFGITPAGSLFLQASIGVLSERL